jgi:hypothetical protein
MRVSVRRTTGFVFKSALEPDFGPENDKYLNLIAGRLGGDELRLFV